MSFSLKNYVLPSLTVVSADEPWAGDVPESLTACTWNWYCVLGNKPVRVKDLLATSTDTGLAPERDGK